MSKPTYEDLLNLLERIYKNSIFGDEEDCRYTNVKYSIELFDELRDTILEVKNE